MTPETRAALKWKCTVTYRWQPPPDYPKPVQSLGTGGNGMTPKLRVLPPLPSDPPAEKDQ